MTEGRALVNPHLFISDAFDVPSANLDLEPSSLIILIKFTLFTCYRLVKCYACNGYTDTVWQREIEQTGSRCTVAE